MGKATRTKAEDNRKPKHSRDASRPSKGGKGQRDAATVPAFLPLSLCACSSNLTLPPLLSLVYLIHLTHGYCTDAGSTPQDVQQDSKEGQEWEYHTPGVRLSYMLGCCRDGIKHTLCHQAESIHASFIYFLQDLQSKELPNTRIQPDRRWFGNTRVIGQKQLDQFREEMSAKVSNNLLVGCLRMCSRARLPIKPCQQDFCARK